MVELSPFRAIRYASGGDLSRVLAPPYDVIDAVEQGQLYDRDPHNIVRIDLNRAETSDHSESRYERAAEFLSRWQKEGVLTLDDRPSIYVLAQTFVGPDGVERTRTGFSAWCAAGPGWGPGSVQDWGDLACVFGAYRDSGGEVFGLIAAVQKELPLATAQQGKVRNHLWRVPEGPITAAISAALAQRKLYIADGHHRYETGLAYRDERRAAESSPRPDAGYEHILMFSAAVEDPGMVIFPTHRLVHSLARFELEAVLTELRRYFEVRALGPQSERAQEALAAEKKNSAFLLSTREAKHLLVLRGDAPLGAVATLPAHPALRELDVSVLHAVVLETILGVTPEAQASQANLRYSKDWGEAFTAPEKDATVAAALLMNPTEIEEVIAVAESGEVMPQKSTFFYPKIPTGLVLYPLG
jgi:uncharacterized protein (DUF1015 family)